tara:strand:+ start:2135 stop:2620 length:486 start_codon:yes stop_codon:yes gene_type:complete
MTSCLAEMQKLQDKMKILQEEKRIQEDQQKEKINKIEPNIAVMEKWIKSIAKIKDEYIIEQKVKNLNKDSNFMSRQSCGNINQYEIEIFQKWTEIQQRRSTPRRVGEQQEEIFHIQECKNRYRPSKFMIDYIEATYNLFQIQQKRIEELENVVAQITIKEN